MSLVEVIRYFAGQASANSGQPATYVVRRSGAGGAYVHGRWVETTPTTFSISGSIQRAGDESLQDLPVGMSADDARTLWTETELKTVNDDDGTPGSRSDVVVIGGVDFRVFKVFPATILDRFFRVAVGKVGVP